MLIMFTVISCPSFNVSNGAVTINSLQYLGEANIMCDPSHWAPNGEQNLTVTCQADKNWNINVTCQGKTKHFDHADLPHVIKFCKQ